MKRFALFKLPLYLLLAGIAENFLVYITVFRIARWTKEWTLNMGAWATGVSAVIALVLFVLIGLRLRQKVDRRTCVWSVLLVVGYSLLSLALEQAFQYFGTYSMLNYYMYIPLGIFTAISSAVFQLIRCTDSMVPHVILSILLPFLFLLFVKPRPVENGQDLPIEP